MKCKECSHIAVCSRYIATGGTNNCKHFMPQKHGQWERFMNGDGEYRFICSACERSVSYESGGTNYCPNCGAKMDGGSKNAKDCLLDIGNH